MLYLINELKFDEKVLKVEVLNYYLSNFFNINKDLMIFDFFSNEIGYKLIKYNLDLGDKNEDDV